MAEPLPPPSLSRAREQKIEELSNHFANDDLSLDDLEKRIELVYKAASIAELEAITADLRPAPPLADSRTPARSKNKLPVVEPMSPVAATTVDYEVPKSRLLAVMSSTRRVGRWAVPRDLGMFALMSDNRLDLTQAALPVGGVVNIEITAIMASVKIIVSPGMRVINEIHSFMADVKSEADELATDGVTRPTTPVIRLVGTAIMTDVKVKVRRREDPIYDDE